MLTLSDEELVARCKVELPGDTRSYELLVQRHMNRVYGLVLRIINNKEEAEDITQEVFLKVYNNLKKFEQQATFTTWLYKVATNSALDALDKINRRPKATQPLKKQANAEEEVDILSLQPSNLPDPETQAVQSELRECINRVLKKLKKDDTQLLVMRDFNDMNYDEIANLLGLGLSAAKMRIHRARLSFQEQFGKLCGKVYMPFSPKK
jgi:RNA polymerase sigma-70 factor (ECF subfamily)